MEVESNPYYYNGWVVTIETYGQASWNSTFCGGGNGPEEALDNLVENIIDHFYGSCITIPYEEQNVQIL